MGKSPNIWGHLQESFLDWVFYSPCGGEKRFRRKCLDFASPLKGENILDVCCGTGSFSYMMASRVGFEGQVVGLDLCKTAIEVARNRAAAFHVKFLIANAESLSFISSQFDKCFIIFGLHHMTQQARQNTLNEVLRALKSAGT